MTVIATVITSQLSAMIRIKIRVYFVLPVLWVLLVLRDRGDYKDFRDLWVLRVKLVLPDHRVLSAKQEHKALPVRRVLPDHRVQEDSLEGCSVMQIFML